MDVVRALEIGGCYERGVDTSDAQSVVDIRWAAHQAGRLLGVRTRVIVAGAGDPSDSSGTATVITLDGGVAEQLRARQGLDALLRSVRQEQTRTLVRPVVPEPRRRAPMPVGSHVVGS